MTALREAAQQALEALERYQVKRQDFDRFADEITALRAALAQEQAEPVQEPVASLMTHVQSGDVEVVWNDDGFDRELWHETPLYAAPTRCPNCASLEAQNDELDRKLAEMERADLSRCPQCGGPADNGHDRSIPPNPYLCTKCMAEPVAEIIESEIKVDSHQTLDDAMRLPRAMAQAYERGYKAGAAAERKRIIQFLQEMQRQVGDGHNHYGVAAMRIRERV